MMKRCTKCSEIKSLSEFYKTKKTKSGYRGSCKECMKQSDKNYYNKNKESVQKRHKEYGQSEKSREGARKRAKKYFESEKGKAYKEHLKETGYFEEYRKQYYQENHEKYYMSNVKRRSNKNNVRFAPIQRREILERDDWTCQYCGVKVHDEKRNDELKANIDHIIPISKGGNSEPSNLQVLCRTCNLKKKDKIVI